ncbi:uncharacterized protein LOC144333589 [Macaca mulatta]
MRSLRTPRNASTSHEPRLSGSFVPRYVPGKHISYLVPLVIKLHHRKVLQVSTPPGSPAGFTSQWPWLRGLHSYNPEGARFTNQAQQAWAGGAKCGPGSSAPLSPHPHQARAHPEPAPASEHRAQPQLPPAPLPPHLEPAEGAGSRLGQPQRGAPTAQPRAEGLLERGQSGRRGRGGAQSERGLPARCHLSMGDEGRKPYHDAAQSPPQKLTRQPPDLGLHSLQNCKRCIQAQILLTGNPKVYAP